MKRAFLLALVLLLAGTGSAFAHEVVLGASVTPQTVSMAQHVTYTLFAEWPAGWNVAPPRPPAATDQFDVVGCGQPVIRDFPGGHRRLEMACDLVVFGSGKVPLPAWPLRLTDSAGKVETDTPPELILEVVAPLVDKDARAIKGQENIKRDWLKIGLIAAAAALGAALLVVLIVWLVRRLRRRGGKLAQAEPDEPPDIRALRRLVGPELEAWLFRQEAKPYYSELTDIVREYLEGRFHFPALERTTTEILADLRGLDLKGHEDFLADLLRVADRAKFAGLPVPPGRWTADRDGARKLVQDTRPILAPPVATPAAGIAPEGEAAEPVVTGETAADETGEKKA